MITLNVNTPSHSYPIFIQAGLLDKLSSVLSPYLTHQVAIITNTTVAPLYLERVASALAKLNIAYFAIILPDGEVYKDWQTLNLIFDGLLQNHAERKTTLLALGGGVVGDMVGFAAATYQRGVPFIQIPTTLLSQVDSSVGGKTAINHPLGKNMIGAFYQPQAVLIDIATLNTLPPREFFAGLGEIIKYALIGDGLFLSWLEKNMDQIIVRDLAALTDAIQKSCEMKAEIVAEDETEQGRRALLNFGHTFAHAIETELGYGVWLHGEAVAAGMVVACMLSRQLGYLTEADLSRVQAILSQAKLPIAPPKFSLEKWIEHMSHDKKVNEGVLQFIILKSLGSAEVYSGLTSAFLANILGEV